MKVALYHGYELTGSGSNEYTRSLAIALARLGHEVVVICGEPNPEQLDFVSRARAYDEDGCPRSLFERAGALGAEVSLHRLPRTSVHPVFLTDKRRPGVVKAFPDLTDQELEEYSRAMEATLARVLADERPDVLHANHLVYQPVVAARTCVAAGVPYYVVPHGSSVEYTVKRDPRFLRLAREGLSAAAGIVWISREVKERVLSLFSGERAGLEEKSRLIGVGTDTTLFSPIPPAQREEALAELSTMQRSGGKTEAQERELRTSLAAGDLEAIQRAGQGYDENVEDAELEAKLRDLPRAGDLILFVGALTYGKGVQSLLAAMPEILRRRPGAHLAIVGSGAYREALESILYALESGDEPLFDALAARGRALERGGGEGALEDLAWHASDPERRRRLFSGGAALAGRVRFFGRLDHPRLRLLLPCARVAVFPSVIKEASPLVFAEALSSGVLPAGAYHSGLKDGLDDLRGLVPGEAWDRMKLPAASEARVTGIAECLSALLAYVENHELASQLRDIALKRYDWASVAEKLAEAALAIAAPSHSKV